MAYRRRYKKKTFKRRKTRTARRAKRYPKQSYAQAGIMNAKFKSVDPISTDGSGKVLHEYTDTKVVSLPYNDISSFGNLFDQFRVRAIKLRYYPYFNVVEQASTGAMGPIFIVYDRDNTSLSGIVTTNDIALEYSTVRCKTIDKPWVYYRSFGKVSQNGTGRIDAGGWMDIASYAANQVVSICQQSAGVLPNSSTLGSIVSEYYVQFRGRR